MRTVALVVVLCAAGARLDAQSGNPNSRQGFWIGFGLGAGSVGEDCTSCSDDRINGPAGYLRMGGTLSPAVRLGGELNGWSVRYRGVDRGFGSAAFVVMWYPNRTGAFYLQGGIGGMSYTTDNGTTEVEATAGTVTLGLGFEFRVARNFSIAPYFSAVGSAPVEVTVNGQPSPTGEDIRMSLVHVGIGLAWH